MQRDDIEPGAPDFVALSREQVRQVLGQPLMHPPEFSQPEANRILMNYYEEIDKAKG
jgi:ATP sulfurylase